MTGDARRQTKKPMLPFEPGVSADSRPREQMPRMPPLHSGLTGASSGSAVSGCSAITEEKGKGAPAGAGIAVLLCCYHTVLWVRKQKLRRGRGELRDVAAITCREPRATQCCAWPWGEQPGIQEDLLVEVTEPRVQLRGGL